MQRQAADIGAKLLQKFNETRGDFIGTLPATMANEFANGKMFAETVWGFMRVDNVGQWLIVDVVIRNAASDSACMYDLAATLMKLCNGALLRHCAIYRRNIEPMSFATSIAVKLAL